MATVLLSGLGSAVGGQFGGLLGSMLGRSVDRGLSGAPPRVKEDLSVQTAAYGSEVPRLYGRMRVGGAVVWATDIQFQIGSSGKFGPDATRYWANFAVALSSRNARGVRRIWADGKLLRGADGEFKVPTKFRFYSGEEDQQIDPLIGSIEGLEETPAYRGLALAVFEELQLAEFGNRIPLLTFEVEADEEAPSIRDILSDVSGDRIADEVSGPAIDGFAALGDDAAAALSSLATSYGVDDLGAEWLHDQPRSFSVQPFEMGCSSDDPVVANELRRSSSLAAPSEVRVGYFDSGCDLQASEQRVVWSPQPGAGHRVELPASMSASAAKTLGEKVIAREWRRRDRLTLRLPQRFLGLRPRDRLTLPDGTTSTVKKLRLERSALVVECQREDVLAPSVAGSSGRIVANVDLQAPRSEILLLDLPALDAAASTPSLTIVGRGGAAPWRPFPIVVDAFGQSADLVIEQRALIGRAQTVLPDGSCEVLDRKNEVVVVLADDDWLQNCTSDALLSGANLALLGSELIQFAEVTPLGERSFALRQLLRGRFATEWASDRHVIDEPFVLLSSAAPKQLALSMDRVGSTILAEGHAVGDRGEPSRASVIFEAEALRPPSPVHLAAKIMEDGTVLLTWVRRSRCGYHWFDRLEVPLAEEAERYSISVISGVSQREFVTTEPKLSIAPADLSGLGANQIVVEVRQLGSALASRPATLQMGM